MRAPAIIDIVARLATRSHLASRHFTTTATALHDDPLTTVHRGVAFEERALRVLERTMSMSLERVGGKGDGGVDLTGWWWLPKHAITRTAHPSPLTLDAKPASEPRPDTADRARIRVFAQCKAEQKKIGPRHIREMEGMLSVRTAGHRSYPVPEETNEVMNLPDGPMVLAPSSPEPIVGLFLSETPFTRASIACAMSSRLPMFLLHLPPLPKSSPHPPSDPDSVGGAIWNKALGAQDGLLGGTVEVRWERGLRSGKSGEDPSFGRPALWYNGRRLPHWVDEHNKLKRLR